MKRLRLRGVFVALAVYALTACRTGIPPSPTTVASAVTNTLTPTPEGETIVVTSTSDSGEESLRQALENAQPGDTITFDSNTFPPGGPVSIYVESELPPLSQGQVTIDASTAGVILDGKGAGGEEEWIPGLRITSSGNVVQGLQIVRFSGAGIVLESGATQNTIGGDRGSGDGPLGQGNLSAENSDGVALFGASGNFIRGNLIGTDVSGTSPMPNRGPGILLMDGAQGNEIGPDNIVAFNGDAGIEIRTSDSTGNTVTRNSIHDNGSVAFQRQPGFADRAPNPPIIIDFDLGTGDVTGVACPSCVVEVFSDDGYDAEYFEETATAELDGTFTINTGAPLRGPGLTATATVPGPGGSTSTLSAPTSGASHAVMFQEGNGEPKTFLQTGRPVDLEQNRIGDMFPLDRHPEPCPLAEEDWSFTHVDLLGFKWVRLSLDRLEWHTARDAGDFSQFEINTCQEQIVDLLVANDVTILYTLVHWDEDLHADRYPNYTQEGEEEVQRFLDYTRSIVSHFKGRIQYYEVLNEGHVYVELDDYINLIIRAVKIIQEEDPAAKVVVGGASNLRLPFNQRYVLGLAESNVMSLVDGINLHPMYGSSPDYAELEQYYYGYDEFIRYLQDTASAHDFSGEYFAEEMDWRMAFNENPDDPWVYSEPVAAKYYARGIVINRGLGLYAGIGGEYYDTVPEIVRVVQSLTASMAGAEPTEGPSVLIDSEAPITRSYWFTLGNGDLLLALWTDGVAVDDDPGISSTLILRDFSADEVTGIDILYGFEQQIDAQNEGDLLVIHHLLLKDYPVFLRFSGVPTSP